jgi:hypothetical protein
MEALTMGGLSVGDGFKFGCGFFIAGFIAWLVMIVIMALIMVVFETTFGTILENWGAFGSLLPLLTVI